MSALSLMVAAALSLAVAFGHFVFAFVSGPAGYRYFGAGDQMARLSEAGSPIPPLVTLLAAALFGLAALYGLSGAGAVRALPLLRPGLSVVSAVYLIRGSLVAPQLVSLWSASGTVLPRQIGFSLVSLLIGAAFAIGTAGSWRELG